MPFTLAIEMSNPGAPHGTPAGVVTGPSVAVRNNESGELHEEPVRTGSRDVDDLVPAIERVCARAGASPADLALVAVSVGPGGYTSVRMSVAAAATIAHARGVRVAPVPTALAVAHALEEDGLPALICLASKRDTAHASIADASRALAGTLGIVRASDLAAHALDVRTLVGDHYLHESFEVAGQQLALRTVAPTFGARFVLGASASVELVTPEHLRAIYPREPDAVTQWRARHPG